MDIISYVLSKKYTNDTVIGLGALKGANCTIRSIVHQDGVNVVTFEWTGTDGTIKTSEMIVNDGTPIYTWQSGNHYLYGDLVIYESTFYRCIVENEEPIIWIPSARFPDSSRWVSRSKRLRSLQNNIVPG